MHRLCLFRHAKSDWFAGATGDFDRPISARGKRDAPLVSANVRANGWQPGRILCSPSKRTRQTLDILARYLGSDPDIDFLAELYDASSADYMAPIRAHGGDAETLMIIGHNPMIHETALRLAAPGTSQAVAELDRKYPTCALAVLEFETGWADLTDHSGKLVAFVKPADLRPK